MKRFTLLMVGLSLMVMSFGCAGRHHGTGQGYGSPSLDRVVPEVNQLVEQHVKDPDKAKQIKAMVQDIVEEVKRSSQQTRGYHEQLTNLNADYGATPEQFMKVLDEMNHARMTSASKVLGKRFQIKELLTAQEWKNLTDAMAKARSRYTHTKGSEGMSR
ncbi:MAG: hypothetical protein ACREJU_03930 [Nitrospiraceae bacterium]